MNTALALSLTADCPSNYVNEPCRPAVPATDNEAMTHVRGER